jgi:type IV pilus assembly protein PilE
MMSIRHPAIAAAPRAGRARGFTLIELMITVAIVAVLLAVAMPSYQGYVRKSARASAQSHLMALAAKQEQFLLDQKAYTGTLSSLNLAQPAETTGRYTFSVTVGNTPPSYTLTATATGTQLSDGNLSLTNTGLKSPADKWK